MKAIMEGVPMARLNNGSYFRVIDTRGNVLSDTLYYSATAYCVNMVGDAKTAGISHAILAVYDAARAYVAGA